MITQKVYEFAVYFNKISLQQYFIEKKKQPHKLHL